MSEVIISGYYTENQCKKIKEKMQGKSFFNFDISYSNSAGNCSLIVRTDIEKYSSDKLKEMFVYCCISELTN